MFVVSVDKIYLFYLSCGQYFAQATYTHTQYYSFGLFHYKRSQSRSLIRMKKTEIPTPYVVFLKRIRKKKVSIKESNEPDVKPEYAYLVGFNGFNRLTMSLWKL